ncbi:MAG TPA: ABC transporter substrate-binding protein [Streptosporangiaceae bacterium]|nr:ABC transporter substrate-binding protein [Streptosporangiaceae bacterium]
MRRQLVALVSAATLIAASGTACGGSSTEPSSSSGGVDKITVGVVPIVDVAPIYLGKQKGFFAKRKIDPVLQPASGGGAIVAGVVSGNFKFAFANVVSLMLARDRGLPLKVVANGSSSTGKSGADYTAVAVRKDSPIKTPRDLAGRRISINNLQNIGDTTVRASIRKAGGDPASPKFVEINFTEAWAAVTKKQVDAAFLTEPFVTQALAQGGRVVAWNYVDSAPNLTVATYFTTEKVISSENDLVSRFKAAINESLQYASSHPDEARAAVATYTKIPPSTLAKIVLPLWPAQINQASIQTLGDDARGDGLLKKAPDVTGLLE